VHFGEAFANGRIDRKPPGSVRYQKTTATLAGAAPVVAAPPPDKRNTEHRDAILTPPEWGVILPFRWVEIEGWPGELRPEMVRRQAAFASTWDDDAAAFSSSNPLLDRVWELCRYSIKATTFAGVYVDGDRERIPYEADAHLNQLSHYATDRDVRMARDTFDRLMQHPTWPTEWASYMIMIAHADWMHTGDTAWVGARYESLKPKLLLERARADGLLVSNEAQVRRNDIVDWPAGERDGFVFKPVNTVVNAFHIHTLGLMAELAAALGKDAEAADYRAKAARARVAFQNLLFMPESGRYRDGEGTDHTSLHASLFPLAFGLVPDEHRATVARWLAGRGMACSVYAAQYLLEGLFRAEMGREALDLMLAPNDRSWKHMVESGTTITWEAWDQKYKPNQDWNHAWGAAPANLLPRFVLGVEVLEPGWKRAVVRPHPGGLDSAEGKIPTPRGPVLVSWKSGETFRLNLTLPAGVAARVELPARPQTGGVFSGGNPIVARASRGQPLGAGGGRDRDGRVGGGPVLSGVQPASMKAAAAKPEPPYRTSWYPFTEHKDADTCWSLSVGPDGTIRNAASGGAPCSHSTPERMKSFGGRR
jgi:alpha-L-rhamnosidase